jgi:hypothetical protein
VISILIAVECCSKVCPGTRNTVKVPGTTSAGGGLQMSSASYLVAIAFVMLEV